MNATLSEFSIVYVVLTELVPPLITVLLGGVLASVLFPRWQARHARYHAREDRRLALAEELSRNMTRYIASWNRLRSIAELEASRPNGLTEAEFERKRAFVEARNSVRDAMTDTMCSLEIYCSDEVRCAIDDFMRWDESCSVLRLEELPPRGEYARWRRDVLTKVRREIAR